MRDGIFGDKTYEILRTWRPGRLGSLVDSILSYAGGHELGEQDRRTLIDAACAYNRNARRRGLSHRYDIRAMCTD